MTAQPKKVKVLVLGGGYAGLMAVSRLRQSRQPVDITLVDSKPYFEQRIRLHEVMAGKQVDRLDYRKVLNQAGVTFIQARVVAIKAEEKQVLVDSKEGERSKPYDILVYALGSSMNETAVPGVQEFAYCINTYQQATALSEKLSAVDKVTVIGGGLSAIEISSELAEAYPQLTVQMVCRGKVAEDYLDEAREYLMDRFRNLGVQVYEEQTVEEIQASCCRLGNGERLDHGLCIWAGGFTVSPLAMQSGLEVDDIGRVVTDPCLRAVSDNAIYAVGDAARIMGKHNKPHRMGCVTAMPHGAYVGESIKRRLARRPIKPFRFRYVFRCLSLARTGGLIQFTDEYDRPTKLFLSRFLGRRIKEWICRMTFYSVKWELSTGLPLYMWLKGTASGLYESDGIPPRANGVQSGTMEEV
ncbi:NAD(P)/FAD-dependent oxidoreductase [Hahella ganghwensis]|uniref:NAD(P)/FAD-dependent oxidoreductase n=1 Tax=Hahella ganghwensis TaxID=286420 RepID=UPI0003609DE3|nr:FAD-dependent oxidoreductase [Hahella ganghwensis]